MRRSALRARSKRHAKNQRALAALIPALQERSQGMCEARFSKFCTRRGSVPHHIEKHSARPGHHELHLVLWTCPYCNNEIEDRPLDAIEAGVSIRSWERDRFMAWMAPHVECEDDAVHNFATCLADARANRRSFQDEFEALRIIFLTAATGALAGQVGDYVWIYEERAS